MTEQRVALLDIWTFATDPAVDGLDLTGWSVEATDGKIGKIDEATYETGDSCLVVDAGPWLYGNKKVVIPAGIIDGLEGKTGTVFVNRTQEEIANAPEFDEERGHRDSEYRQRLGGYYNR